MRLLVFSDSHRDKNSMLEAIQAQPSARTILFLGDGMGDLEYAQLQFPEKDFYAVSGNCDLASMEPLTRLLAFGGKRIMMTHGHEYHVKFGRREAEYTARRNGCDLLLFGHTHQPFTDYADGLYIMNPGSANRGNSHTYGVVDLVNGGIFCNIVKL
ncbi:MAG: YfcE family phosphodiesterase [Clostridia bacterium]|nr:YfcE family phosphodiesterase [Clostridia bacterium]